MLPVDRVRHAALDRDTTTVLSILSLATDAGARSCAARPRLAGSSRRHRSFALARPRALSRRIVFSRAMSRRMVAEAHRVLERLGRRAEARGGTAPRVELRRSWSRSSSTVSLALISFGFIGSGLLARHELRLAPAAWRRRAPSPSWRRSSVTPSSSNMHPARLHHGHPALRDCPCPSPCGSRPASS